jgi:hypothetical protein
VRRLDASGAAGREETFKAGMPEAHNHFYPPASVAGEPLGIIRVCSENLLFLYVTYNVIGGKSRDRWPANLGALHWRRS